MVVLLSGVFSSSQREHERVLNQVTQLTHFPSIALSTSFLENRTMYYGDASNRIYPKMQGYQQMDYVYAQ